MATCRDIATRALRKLGVVAAGRDPRQVDLDSALAALDGLYRMLISAGTFGRLRDVTPLTDYHAQGMERVNRRHMECQRVYLPAMVADDPVWCDPCVYGARWVPPAAVAVGAEPPRDCAIVVINDVFSGTETTWIFDGQGHQWQRIGAFDLDGNAPVSWRDPEGLACLLARELSDEYGAGIGPQTERRAGEFRSALAYRWSSPREPEYC